MLCNYLSTPKLQRLHCSVMGMMSNFITLHNRCDCLSKLGLMLIHVSVSRGILDHCEFNIRNLDSTFSYETNTIGCTSIFVIWWAQLRLLRIWCCHYLPPGSLITLGHPSLFHSATSLLVWYKMFCVRDISSRLIWIVFINMFSVYAQSGMHSRFDWQIIVVLTYNPSVLMCVDITDAPKL